MKFAKIRDVKSPSRGTSKSAGLDFYVPNYSEEYLSVIKEKNPYLQIDEKGIMLHSHQQIIIPSGIKVKIPDNYSLIAFNKSGIFLNMGLDVGACVIDSDYMGEIGMSLFNTTNDSIKISFGQKIIQFVLIPILLDEVEELNEKDIYLNVESCRKDGGFGSTGIN